MASNLLPYSIHTGNRPFRIAFLIDPKSTISRIDSIFEYNREKWGGRYNPIIFTDGEILESNWWQFLKEYDPDIIYSTVTLSQKIKQDIQTFLSPLSIQYHEETNTYIRLDEYPLSILPTDKNISALAQNVFFAKTTLVLFEVDGSTPNSIKAFISRNFGVVDRGSRASIYAQTALLKHPTKTYKITDFGTLNKALLELGEFHNNSTFLSQLCSLPNSSEDVKYDQENEKFNVVIGDSISDLAYFWNRTLTINKWLRTRLTHIWLPKELAINEITKEGLEKFINRYTGQTGNANYHGTNLVSFSLTDKEIKDINTSLTGKMSHPLTFSKLDTSPYPILGKEQPFFSLRKGLELHRAYSNEEHLILNEPDIEEGIAGGEHWLIDLYIQFRPERFANAGNINYWWQLPSRNSLLRDLGLFNKPARINKDGSFSVLMKLQSPMDIIREEEPLVIKIPQDDTEIFRSLSCGEAFNCIETDGRGRFTSRPFHTMVNSDKGKYLFGVLSLFKDLSTATGFFEDKKWRRVFEKLSNKSSVKDALAKQVIINKLKKNVHKDFKNSGEDAEWLAEYVLLLAKDQAKEDTDLSFDQLCDIASAIPEKFRQTNEEGEEIFDREELRQEVSDLISAKILLLGIKPRCQRCGYRIWHHLNEAEQNVTCRGCGYAFSINAEEKWSYKLNSLIRIALTLHGTIPVLLVYGQLLSDAKSSFLFVPSIELFKNYAEDTGSGPCGEIDLVCIQDGKFIIGEIKQSVGLFKERDFIRMAEIAKRIRPNLVIFSSMDLLPNNVVKSGIEKLKAELGSLEIEVKWYPLNHWMLDSPEEDSTPPKIPLAKPSVQE